MYMYIFTCTCTYISGLLYDILDRDYHGILYLEQPFLYGPPGSRCGDGLTQLDLLPLTAEHRYDVKVLKKFKSTE
jgi:hypothetical protein